MPDALISLKRRLDDEAAGRIRMLPTPWPTFNYGFSGGFGPESLTAFVGVGGSAKTWIILQVCLHAFLNGWKWAYWPFEMNDEYTARRLLTVLVNDWRAMEVGRKENPDFLNDGEVFEAMAKLTDCIEPNPAQLTVDAQGRVVMSDSSCDFVADRLHELCMTRDLVVLDPLTMVGFDEPGKAEWQTQTRFVQRLAAIRDATRSRLLIVTHTRRAPAGARVQTNLSDVAGGEGTARFFNNVVFLEHHPDGLESDIVDRNGIRRMQSHKRTMYLAKVRDGRGTGWRIACDLSDSGPQLTEYGVVLRKKS